MPHSQESILTRYGVSVKHGFLPGSAPLKKLEDSYYEPWEKIAGDLPNYIQTGSIRQAVESLPILSTSSLHSEQEWQRAYVVLAFLTHAYIWGAKQPKDVSYHPRGFNSSANSLQNLPPCISSPFLEISSHLELPPCATYAAVCLWNYSVKPNATGLTEPDDLTANTLFTGTKDEEWFFMVSISIEEIGAKTIPLMLDAFDAVDTDDSHHVASLLSKIANGINETTHVLGRMIEKCTPVVFFHQVRPFLAGSKNMAAAGLPKGVFYDRGDGVGEWHENCGGSNAQSSLIQAFDIFLGVEHSATGESGSQASGKNAYLHVSIRLPSHLIEFTRLTDQSTEHERIHAWPSPPLPRIPYQNLQSAPLRHEPFSRVSCQNRLQ